MQERAGGTPTANIVFGPATDEPLVRSDSTRVWALVADGLGSALALLDPSGAVRTQYTYGAFGSTSATGTGSGNTAQYTGRENDGTGLYYYRARYYSPGLQRFVSEDPLEFGAGDPNLYAYVGNSPVMSLIRRAKSRHWRRRASAVRHSMSEWTASESCSPAEKSNPVTSATLGAVPRAAVALASSASALARQPVRPYAGWGEPRQIAGPRQLKRWTTS